MDFEKDFPKKMHFGCNTFEKADDDTLMGRLAKRMASRDYIDKQNLGMGTKTARTAATADEFGGAKAPTVPTIQESDIPTKMSMGGKVEMEHKDTIKKISDTKPPKVAEMIAKDHKEEDKQYYPKLKKAGL